MTDNQRAELTERLRVALNVCSAENASNTPDHVLADYLMGCLDAWNNAVNNRAEWHDNDRPDPYATEGRS